jgi:hypothetical protein
MGSRRLSFPYAEVDPRPSGADAVRAVGVDHEVGREAFWYELASGAKGYVHAEQVLEYNRDPSYVRDQLLYRLTVEAQRHVAESPLAKREIIRRLNTSAAQFYRLLDQTNYRKSIDQMLALLQILDCKVDLVFRERGAA